MALIECYECKGKVSSKAKACPHCGLPIEVAIEYYDDGQMKHLILLKDGKLHGLRTWWYKNGQKQRESRWKNGKLISAVHWKPNGEKCPVTKIDEEGNGIVVWYTQGGTESDRYTYKDGKRVED